MKCQLCSNPATMHLTRMINKQKLEIHLCEACAREQNLIPSPPQELNIPALLQLVLGQLPVPVKVSQADLVCPECGTPYAHFRAQGRLGCPHDYEAFRSLLEPLLERVQSNAIRHAGKVPRRYARRMRVAQKAELVARLQAAVSAERYEEAAQLRDAIRALGAGHEP
jgi:protein arginine kinase activator